MSGAGVSEHLVEPLRDSACVTIRTRDRLHASVLRGREERAALEPALPSFVLTNALRTTGDAEIHRSELEEKGSTVTGDGVHRLWEHDDGLE